MNKDLFFVHQDFQNLTSSFGNRSSGTKDSSYTSFIQEIIVLCRNYTTCNYDDILTAQLLQFVNDLRNQCLVSGSQ